MSKMDWIIDKNRGHGTSKGRISKDILRPVYHDDNKNFNSGKVTKALTAATGVPGTKTKHMAIAAQMARIPKEDKVDGREHEFREVKNKLGKTVRVGKIKIVKAKNVVKDIPVKVKGVKVKPSTLGSLLRKM